MMTTTTTRAKEMLRFFALQKKRMKTTFLKLPVVLPMSVLCLFVALGNACGPSEYKSSQGECCPMCYIGSVVYQDCVGDSKTGCKLCSRGTFMSEPNGLYKCFICNNCSESQGLYIQSQCTTIKDTICDVLDGYYCIDFSNSSCHHAQKHGVCKPGQQIKTPGTKRSDTVCEDCPSGFYSLAGVKCIKWTECKARNEFETEAGSSIKDVTCKENNRHRYYVMLPVSAFVMVIIIICFIALNLKQQDTLSHRVKQLLSDSSERHQTPRENEETTVDCSRPPRMKSVTDHKHHRPTLLPAVTELPTLKTET